MDWGGLAAVGSGAFGAIATMFAGYRTIMRQMEAIRVEAIAATEKAAAAQETARNALSAKTEAAMKDIEKAVNQLRSDTVRKDEFIASEARTTAGLTRMENKLDKLGDKIDAMSARQVTK